MFYKKHNKEFKWQASGFVEVTKALWLELGNDCGFV